MNAKATIIALGITYAALCGAGNLWENPGFETWNSADHLPSAAKWRWGFPKKKAQAFEIYARTDREKHSGTWALHLKDTDSGRENQNLTFIIGGSEPGKMAGKILRFSAWVKQVSASAPKIVGISIGYLANGKWNRVSSEIDATGPTVWQELKTKVRIPEGATLILASLQCANGWGGTAEAYFDDIVLTTDSPDEKKEPLPKKESIVKKTESKAGVSGADTSEIAAYRESYRKQAPVSVDSRTRPEIRNGTWYVNGKPEYYLGVWLYNRTNIDWSPGANPLKIDHIGYTTPPGTKVFEHMGFNSSQISAAHTLPGMALNNLPLPKDWKTKEAHIGEFFTAFKDIPLVMDFAFGYSKDIAKLNPRKHKELDQRNGKWHEFIPYCPEHPEGDRYYHDYFEGGTKAALKYKSNIFLYELFNESSYNCQCRFNAREFAKRMKVKYGTIENANKVWGTVFDDFNDVAALTNFAQYKKLWPDWCKFSADRYAEILVKYKKLIQSIDKRPNVFFTEQAAGLPPAHTGMDYRKIADVLDVLAIEGGWSYGFASDFQARNEMEAVVAAGGSTHYFNCDFYQALTKGKKTIVNNEHYCTRSMHGLRVPSKREDMITSLWMEVMHGVSSNFTYVWDKRSWDWKTFDEAKRNVLQMSYKSSSLLNPYNWPPEQLDAFKLFQRELAPYKEKILPFPRTKPATVAVFFSYPTLRMGEHIKKNYMKEVTKWYTEILHAHYPVKVVFEEELKNLGAEVQALVFPGAEFATPDTVKDAEAFRKRGGLVIAGKDAFQWNEYSAPLAPEKNFLRASKPQDAVAMLGKRNVRRYAVLEPADGQERFTGSDVQVIDRGEFKLIALVNRNDMGSRLAVLKLFLNGEKGPFYLTDVIKKRLILNGNKETWTLAELAKGFKLILPAQERVVLTLETKCPSGVSNYTERDRTSELEKRLVEERPGLLAFRKTIETKKRQSEESRIYRDVQREKCRPLDLRNFANMHFKDDVAGDKKGGWFDQGANDFANMPLGKQIFSGVPFEIINPAENNGKGVLILWGTHRDFFPKEFKNIPVGMKAKYVYFLHTMGWDGKLAVSYRIRYKDGSTLEIPIRGGQEIAGWWGVTELPNAKIAVESWNTEKDKINMQCFRWTNPAPEKEIQSLDLVSAQVEALPTIAAITVEQP